VGDIIAKRNFILHSMKAHTPKYRYQLWGKESVVTAVAHFIWRNVTCTVGCAVNCVATVDVTTDTSDSDLTDEGWFG